MAASKQIVAFGVTIKYRGSEIAFYPHDAMLEPSAVLAVIVCPSVRLSVRHTPVLYIKTAKPSITQTTPYNSALVKNLAVFITC